METLYKLLKEDGDALLQENDGLILLDSMKLVDVNDQITSSEEITTSNTLAGIDLNDSLTISENFTKQNLIFINTGDNATISEEITTENFPADLDDMNDWIFLQEETTVFIPDLGGINVFDEITAEDLFGQNVTILDYVTISENISFETTLGSINVSDEMTISDNFGGAPEIKIDVEEIMVMIESNTMFNSIINLSTLSEEITISELASIENSQLGGINVADSITISENKSEGNFLNGISVFDSLTISENNLGGYIPFLTSVDDSITISEQVNVELMLFVDTSSNLAIFDNFDNSVIHHAFASDIVTVSESITFESFRFSPGAKRVGKLGASL